MKKLIGFYNPYLLLPHQVPLNLKKFQLSKFFLSFGDTFQYLLRHFNFSQDNIALLPNFYCPETLNTIRQNIRVVYYQINPDFSVDKKSYFNQIKAYQPDIIINYSFTGFSLTEVEKEELKNQTKPTAVIIDDAAHSLLENNFLPLNSNHFLINSLRKHSPFLGSHLLGANFKLKKNQIQWLNIYKVKCLALQWARNFFDLLSLTTNIEKFSDLSDKFFLAQDAIIGEYKKPTHGCPISFYLYQTVNWEKIKKHRKSLAIYFSQKMQALDLPKIKALPPRLAENSNMNYLPIFIDQDFREKLLDYLTAKKIFADILWEVGPEDPDELNQTLYQSFIIYPLTWFIKENDIDNLIKILIAFGQENHE